MRRAAFFIVTELFINIIDVNAGIDKGSVLFRTRPDGKRSLTKLRDAFTLFMNFGARCEQNKEGEQ